MSTSTSIVKPPKWFMVLAIFFLLYNLVGVFAFLLHVLMTDEMLNSLSSVDRNLYLQEPGWSKVMFGIATVGAAIASLGLSMRKKWAAPIFILSLIGVGINMFYTFFMSEVIKVKGATAAIFPMVVVVIALFLVWFSQYCGKQGWLNK